MWDKSGVVVLPRSDTPRTHNSVPCARPQCRRDRSWLLAYRRLLVGCFAVISIALEVARPARGDFLSVVEYHQRKARSRRMGGGLPRRWSHRCVVISYEMYD